jgi:hypothetical protein
VYIIPLENANEQGSLLNENDVLALYRKSSGKEALNLGPVKVVFFQFRSPFFLSFSLSSLFFSCLCSYVLQNIHAKANFYSLIFLLTLIDSALGEAALKMRRVFAHMQFNPRYTYLSEWQILIARRMHKIINKLMYCCDSFQEEECAFPRLVL